MIYKKRFGLLLLLIFLITTAYKPAGTSWTAIGDSITYLNDHLDETGNRVTKGYITRVIEQLPDVKYINQGHNGWQAIGIAKKIETLGLEKTDVYSVLLGTNDWSGGKALGNFEDYKNNTGLSTVNGAFRVIIDKIRSLNPDAKIILMTPLQRGDFVYVADKKNNATGSYHTKNGQSLSQFADAVKQIAAYEHLKLVDLYYKSGIEVENVVKFKRVRDTLTHEYKDLKYPKYVGIPFNPANDEYPYPVEAINYTFDGLHPSDKGNQRIADMLVKAIKE